MSYRLVIAEKPSVAQAYAKVLGATNRNDGYLEGNGYLVSWCIGHLVNLPRPMSTMKSTSSGASQICLYYRKSGSTSCLRPPKSSLAFCKS